MSRSSAFKCVIGLMAAGFCLSVSGAAVAEPRPAKLQSQGSVGDQERTYAADGDLVPYRLYVPTTWRPGDKAPMVVVLHGGGADQDGPFVATAPEFTGRLQNLAESHHFIVVAPNGRKGGWGAEYKLLYPPALVQRDGSTRAPSLGPGPAYTHELQVISAADVMTVADKVATEYGADRSRIYLMGNSMGGFGTFYLAQAHPRFWCAIAPSDGVPDLAVYDFERIKGLGGALMIYGELDNPDGLPVMRRWAEHFANEGVDAHFLSVQQGSHEDAWLRALPQIFDFFASHRCDSK